MKNRRSEAIALSAANPIVRVSSSRYPERTLEVPAWLTDVPAAHVLPS